jgi:pantoate--beta-alanine ligase
MPLVVRTAAELRAATSGTVALVPTMGALHDGHQSLMEHARPLAETLVVSIFVNPTQFAPGEDLDAYPRTFDADLERCDAAGVDVVFAPTVDEMYPHGLDGTIMVDPGPLASILEGAERPTHFRGVLTVVAKLFGLVRPDVAVFGEKDYQQLTVIRRMVLDLDLGIAIVPAPIVRDPDGVAMSSRNRRLGPLDRAAAVCVPRSLDAAAALAAAGVTDVAALEAAAAAAVAAEPRASLEYATVFDPDTLEPLTELDRPARIATAVWFAGDVRLIDNRALAPAR